MKPSATKKHAGSAKHHIAHKHHSTAKHHPTAKQIAALKKADAARHAHPGAKKSGSGGKAKWSPSFDVAGCALEAVAASARMAGYLVADSDVLEAYWRVTDDPDSGMTIEAALETAARSGLGGACLLDARPARRLGDGVVFGVELEQRHAMAFDGHGVWTWGRWQPASCALLDGIDEAWELMWVGAVS